jgi:hypothetical protein
MINVARQATAATGVSSIEGGCTAADGSAERPWPAICRYCGREARLWGRKPNQVLAETPNDVDRFLTRAFYFSWILCDLI